MAQRTLFVRFYYPRDPYNTDNEIKESYFKVLRFNTPGEALDAYANTQADWSTLLNDDEDYHEFIDESYNHIKNHDFDWLYEHFV